MSASMIVLATTTAYSDEDKGAGITAAVFLFVFNSFFGIGWLGMTWLYPAEVTPLAIRAPANAISTTANWIFNVSWSRHSFHLPRLTTGLYLRLTSCSSWW